jgi:hypothetical protein
MGGSIWCCGREITRTRIKASPCWFKQHAAPFPLLSLSRFGAAGDGSRITTPVFVCVGSRWGEWIGVESLMCAFIGIEAPSGKGTTCGARAPGLLGPFPFPLGGR